MSELITEDFVSFETAKLLKEKGFDVWGNGSYDSGIEIYKEYSPSGLLNSCATSKPHPKGYPAPTLQMAMKWLRKVHNLFIGLEYVNILGLGFVYQSTICRFGDDNMTCLCKHSYEEAYEAAIKYCLEKLI